MAYNLQLNHPIILKGLYGELSWRNQKHNINSLVKGRIRTSCENSSDHEAFIKIISFSMWGLGTRREKGINVQASSSLSSTDQELEVAPAGTQETNYATQRGDEFDVLSTENGWEVRRIVERESEMRKVARVQAEAFHEPAFLFDDFFFEFFQAEVLSGLLYRLRNSAPDRYACLVAEPSSNNAFGSETNDLVGVVDCTVLRDDDVLQYLQGADEYLYVSGIAVLRKFRRQKVATALLKACDMLSILWGLEYLVLRAYEDDWGARKLYSNAGYRVVGRDAAWMTTWIGRRRRVLMIKRFQNNSLKKSLTRRICQDL